NPAERFVTLQEPIQRTQLVQRLGRERPAHMLANEASEPLAQSSSLIGNLVQFTGHRSRLQLVLCVRWHKLGLSQPPQEAIARVEPVHGCIERRRGWRASPRVYLPASRWSSGNRGRASRR